MQTNSVPEIEQADVKAARDFLTSLREEGSPAHPAPAPSALSQPKGQTTARGTVTVRNGITRARTRSASKASV